MRKFHIVVLVGLSGTLLTATPASAGSMAADQSPEPSRLDSLNLDEVVVTGQGNAIERRRLSSSFTKISANELNDAPAGRIDEMLQGALPNVQLSMTSGQPGTTSLIKSRGLSSAFGNSTPVIYIDGVRIDNMNTGANIMFSKHGIGAEPYSTADLPMGQTAASGSLSDIPMENIDHIEYVPGGTATTLYGSDAANGVIQIFTKKGGEGHFNASFTTQVGFDVPTTQFYYFGRTRELLNQTGFQQRYRLGFNGNEGKFSYSFGASMGQNTGIVIHDGNNDKKYDLRFGSKVAISPAVEYQNSFGLVVEDYKRSRNGNQGLYTGLWTTECAAAADLRYRDEKDNLQSFTPDIDAASGYEFQQLKAFVDKAEQLQDNTENVKRYQMSHIVSVKPLQGLTLKGTFGLDYRSSKNKEIITNAYLIHTQVKPEGTTDAGRVYNSTRDYLGITIDLNGQYKWYRSSWLSNIATAGFQYFNTHDQQACYNGINVRDGVKVMSGAGTMIADEWLSYLHNYGFYAQDNLGFLNRYYLDLGVRADYNSAFGDNVGWQVYPKVGFSYLISDEPFLQHWRESGVVKSIRLMANAGVAGNYPPAFAYQRTIDMSAYNGQQVATFGKVGNPDLGPEKKHSREASIEASLFKGHFNVGFTYYYAITKDAIFSIPTLPSSGESSTYLANVGKIRNHGMEWRVGVLAVDAEDWKAEVNASLNTNHNRVLSTGGQLPFRIGGFDPATIQNTVAEGKPVGYLQGNKAVLNEDGSLKEVLTLQDLGSTLPTLYGNFSLAVSYKALRLALVGDYQTGSYVHSFDQQFRFRKGLPNKRIPKAALNGMNQKAAWLYFTNYFVSKADFLKIRNIGLDYTFKLKHFAIKRINLALNVYNPLALTASSVDPEATLSGALAQDAVATSGINYATYSSPRQYVFSLKIDI